MKGESVIRARLERLRRRYLRHHLLLSQEKRHRNCVHNLNQAPLGSLRASRAGVETSYELAPRNQHTLIVIQEDRPVGICMFGSDSPADWPGDICDSDSVSSSCPKFRALRSEEEARSDFGALLMDDKLVYERYRDLAALQWVLQERAGSLGLLRRLLRFILRLLPSRPVPSLPPGSEDVASAAREAEESWKSDERLDLGDFWRDGPDADP